MTLHDAAAHFWTHEAQYHKNASSVWGYIAHLERIIGKDVYVDEIDDSVIVKFVAKRRGETARRKQTLVSNSTVNRDVETLGMIFKSVGKIARVPADTPNFRRHRLTEKERIRALTSDEEAALFTAILEMRPDFRDMFEFALLTGKRLSEILFLEKAKVDRRAMTARVIQKGGDEILIALTPATLAIIERNWMFHPSRVFTYVAQRGFTSRDPGKTRRAGQRYPFTIDGWREQWKAILDKAGVRDFRFHDFRHTTATRVLQATGNLKAAQDALGHASIASTARYAHLFTDQRREALAAAERLRGLPESVPESEDKKTTSGDKSG